MIDMEKLKFDEKGLIPAIVVDGTSGQVLTLAYMNRESLAISIREERTCFWSRSRQELWRKGETSGAVQHIIDITADCDCDALVIRVNKEGPACHTGAGPFGPGAVPSGPEGRRRCSPGSQRGGCGSRTPPRYGRRAPPCSPGSPGRHSHSRR